MPPLVGPYAGQGSLDFRSPQPFPPGMIKKLFVAVSLLACVGGVLAQAPPAPAPAPAIDAATPDIQTAVNKAYNDGFALMQDGKFKDALAKVDFIKSKVNRPFPHVTFLEAACYFNLSDFAKAAAAFEVYVKEFPTGENISPVKLGLGRAYLKLNKVDEGIKIMKEAAADPAFKGEAGLLIAEYYKKAEKLDDALTILASIYANGVRSPEEIQAALMAADILVAKGETEKAGQLLEGVKGGGAGTSGESVIQLNNIGLKLGDKMLEEKRFREALAAYQSVRRKSEVVRLQKERIAKLQDAINKGQGNKEEFEAKIASDKAMLDELEKRTDYDASLYYRLGRCYFEMQRPWEAILAFDAIVSEFKDFPQRDKALYGSIMANASLKRIGKALELCERFISDFPTSSEVGAISEMFGMLAYQAGDLQKAADNFAKAMGFPNADKERMRFLRGNVLFEMQRFQDAVTEFELLKKDSPKSAYLDDATYRIALASFYQNDSIATNKALKEYIKNFPKGQYIIDARYRLTFIQFQAAKSVGDVKAVVQELQKLWEESPNDQNIAQVFSLAGDSFNRLSQWDPQNAEEYAGKALEAYANAVAKAKTEDVLNYGMENANDLYVATNRWSDLTAMWQKYLETHKESDNALKAIFWISKGLNREATQAQDEVTQLERRLTAGEEALKAEGISAEQKTDLEKSVEDTKKTLATARAEATKKVKAARQLLADNIKPYISNPIKDQVEVLIQQLCQQMAPKKRRVSTPAKPVAPAPAKEGETAKADAPKEAAAPAPPPAPTGPTFEELEAELEALLKPDQMTPTANIRIMFARATLAQYMKDKEKLEKIYGIIIEVAKPEDLSPLLLSVVGDNARKKGDLDKAAACYERLRTIFPSSEFADGAPVGLGEIYFEKGQFDKAIEMFNEATSDKYQGSGRLLDATLGKAKTLLKLGKHVEAEKEYDQIARTKEWRVAWPNALFGLGQVQEFRKEWGNANSFYRRMLTAHQKYKDWLARAYLQSARCFVLLKKPEDAKATLQEMLKRTDIKDQPEYKTAQAELAKLGG